ncbi:hypothetical protein CDA63_01830 [Hymenobacter amundsenii]|uniref:Uncharacterized protein n=2 Tax=Hymenobacter amundsenii TaxID=2006685 RepID=A0A246FR02_9BACT|nr:hypothetical protein CDA63_01830 [Hymenobacter amundsenii]
MASCQTSRLAVAARSAGSLITYPTAAADSAGTVVLLHDSQGPQGTRAVLSAAEAVPFQQQ